MKISEKWLREWVAPKLDSRALAERLTLAGLEVGSVTPVAAGLAGVIVGEILSVAPHPRADRLRVCEVNVGRKQRLRIVCGAANAAAGLRVPVALPGAKLPSGTAIQQSEIRGVPSAGMLCSAAELGLEQTAEGLLVLDRSARPGSGIVELLQLDDQVLEVDLTPNRGDCLSVAGIARELAALTGARLKPPPIRAVATKSKRRLPVVLEAPGDCPHYVGRVIEGIDSRAHTPLWMRERLRRAGLRSIHPVVDVTNYVMLELGQPMHAFDLAQLNGTIRVRQLAEDQELRMLDGSSRRIERGALVIADDRRPLALAGILGGEDSAVSAGTCDIFLESAYFRPATIGTYARRLGLQTESSQRFERGVDPVLQRPALERATALLLEIVGGRPGPVIEQRAARHLPKRKPVLLRSRRLERLLGVAIPPSKTADILKRLGMGVRKVAGGLRVTAPSYRFDIGRECDLIEEIARLYGYEQLPQRLPRATMAMGAQPETRLAPERLCDLLIDRDYQEAITYSFVDPLVQARLDPATSPARLSNPIASDMAVMRTTLWTGLLQAMVYNQNRQQTRIRLFEIGRRFLSHAGRIDEQLMLAGAVTGEALPEQWAAGRRAVDFYDVKGDVEALLALSHAGFAFEPVSHPALHPGQAAEIVRTSAPNRGRVGLIGALHPKIQAQFGLDRAVLLFELLLDAVLDASAPVYREISKFPFIRRDLALLVDVGTPAAAVLDCVKRAAGGLLANLELFDEYRGEGIDSGRKSLALGLTLQDSSRTLKEDAVEAVLQGVVDALHSELGAQLRQ